MWLVQQPVSVALENVQSADVDKQIKKNGPQGVYCWKR